MYKPTGRNRVVVRGKRIGVDFSGLLGTMRKLLRDRLTVGRDPLEVVILVRIQVPQPRNLSADARVYIKYEHKPIPKRCGLIESCSIYARLRLI